MRTPRSTRVGLAPRHAPFRRTPELIKPLRGDPSNARRTPYPPPASPKVAISKHEGSICGSACSRLAVNSETREPPAGPNIEVSPMGVAGSPYLVALSILVATFASYAALDLGGRVVLTQGHAGRGGSWRLP